MTKSPIFKFSVVHLLILTATAAVLVAVFMSYWNAAREIAGVWKGVDEYGGVHFYQFEADGSLTWWDMDLNKADGSFTKRGPFNGTYEKKDGQFVLKSSGLPTLGMLTLISPDQLQQDFGGHSMRMNLIYDRVEE